LHAQAVHRFGDGMKLSADLMGDGTRPGKTFLFVPFRLGQDSIDFPPLFRVFPGRYQAVILYHMSIPSILKRSFQLITLGWFFISVTLSFILHGFSNQN
jgi:hypothetical protein